MYLVCMRRTTFDQLLCDNELWEKDNSGNGLGNVLECPNDMCGIHAGHTRDRHERYLRLAILPNIDGVQEWFLRYSTY